MFLAVCHCLLFKFSTIYLQPTRIIHERTPKQVITFERNCEQTNFKIDTKLSNNKELSGMNIQMPHNKIIDQIGGKWQEATIDRNIFSFMGIKRFISEFQWGFV